MKKYAFLLLLHCCTVSISGQQGQAILGGVVLDQFTEDTLYWCFISIYDSEDHLVLTARTTYPEGSFQIKNLNTGIYTLKAWRYGRYYPKVIRNVILNEGFTIWHPRLEKDTTRYHLLEEEDVFFSDMQWEEESIYEAPSLYPNPAQDYFQVSAHEGFSEGKIYDINGKVLKRFKLERDTPVFVGDLIKGIYICRIEAPQWSYSYPLKFVKL